MSKLQIRYGENKQGKEGFYFFDIGKISEHNALVGIEAGDYELVEAGEMPDEKRKVAEILVRKFNSQIQNLNFTEEKMETKIEVFMYNGRIFGPGTFTRKGDVLPNIESMEAYCAENNIIPSVIYGVMKAEEIEKLRQWKEGLVRKLNGGGKGGVKQSSVGVESK